jgi:DNA-binding IclR family transcriptional regulator
MTSDPGSMTDPKKTNKSDETLFDIIEHLRTNGPARVTEISKEVRVSKSTVHLHLTTMVKRGYCVKTDGKYDLSLRFLDAGLARKYRNNIFEIVEPRLEELARDTNEQVWYWVEENSLAVVVSQALGSNALSTNGRMGNHLYMHCNAGGKALLAHMSTDRVSEIIDYQGLVEQTENTITTPEALYDELEEIREIGLAINAGESIRGVYAIATPVIDNNGRLRGAISIAGPENRMENPEESEHAEAAMDAAKELGINLTYVDP